MSLAFALPLGHPASTMSGPARSGHLADLRAALTRGTTLFSGDDIFLEFTVRPGAPSFASQMFALWSGAIAAQPASMLTIELPPDAARELTAALPWRAPVPRRVTVGPFSTPPGGARVDAGQSLGALSGGVFRIGFEDANRYWLDPAWCLSAFETLALWDVPAGVNPFVVAVPDSEPIAMAGPALPAQKGRPMLTVSGGEPPRRVFNPGDPGQAGFLSFLSGDTLTLGVFNLPPDHKIAARIEDHTAGASRSSAQTFVVAPTGNASVEFRPDRDLRPEHPPFQAGGGAAVVGDPFRYGVRIDVQHPQTGALVANLTTMLEQSRTEIVRQAFVFHGAPFQATPALSQPAAESLRPAPPAAGLVAPKDIYSSAFFGRGDSEADIAIESGALRPGAEWIRRRYAQLLFEEGALTPDDERFLSADVVVARGWTDPERNELLGGAIDHPSQWALAIDLAPFHTHLGGTLFLTLARAAAEFLTELRGANPAQTFAETTVSLRKGTDELWRWTVEAGAVSEAPGAQFAAAVGGTPSASAAAAAAGAAAAAATPLASPTSAAAETAERNAVRAAVVSVTFAPSPVAARLTPPAIPAYLPDVPPPSGRRCLIVLAGEDSSAPPGSQIPIDVAGKSIERSLRTQFPGDVVDTRVIADPVTLLEELGAFHTAADRALRYVFVLSHAFPHGLQLLHGDNLPDVHDDNVAANLKAVYGRRYAIGDIDLREFKTHQFRVSNLTRLPGEMKARLRARLSQAEGIFLLGCTAGQNAKGISAVLARTVGRPVLGAGDYSKFYRFSGGLWTPLDAVRGTPGAFAVYNTPVVVLPAARGTEQIRMLSADPLDVIAIYRSQLERFDPDSPAAAP